MKNYILTSLLLFTFLFISCSKNDAGEEGSIVGSWNVTNVKGGIMGIDEKFEKGEIIWTFNNNTLTIEKNSANKTNTYSGLKNGTYKYSIKKENNNEFLFIDNTEKGAITYSHDGITVNENNIMNGSMADGYIIELKK